jgi:hypothetical protein
VMAAMGRTIHERRKRSDSSPRSLYERSCTMAERVLAGQVDFIDGVDSCYSAADWAGLVDHYGDDLIQSILAEAFMCARRDAA